jgi:hypothetical protein
VAPEGLSRSRQSARAPPRMVEVVLAQTTLARPICLQAKGGDDFGNPD